MILVDTSARVDHLWRGDWERLRSLPGQKILAIVYADRIELIPVRPLEKMRGFLDDIDTRVERDADRA